MAAIVVLAGAAGGSIYDGNSPLGTPLTLFIAQLVIICTLARVLTKLFAYIKQPSVIAEVVTGIILGPSILGRVPGFTDTIFPESSLQVFGVVSNLGLIFFMFLIGLEVDPRLLTSNLRSSFVISISAMLAPFFLGLAVSTYIYEEVRMAESATFFSFLMFVGVAVSITAFPVLARILTDQNLMQTRVGLIALSSAAVDDVVAWIMLAVVVSIARAEGPLTALYTFGALVAYLFFIAIFIRPILALIARRAQSRDAMKHEVIVIILVMVFVSAWITEVIGVHAIFGAFLLGVVTPRVNGFAIRLTERIEDVVIIILLPLYFTYSGLRTNLESLDSWQGGVMTVLVILASIVGKVGGATISARILNNSWRESLTIGILLNTKGLVELIVLNIGLDVGILTNEIFTGFVLMALFNTFITTPLVWFVWTRHMANAAPVVGKKEYPSILACISGSRADVVILHAAAAFARAQQMATGVKPQLSGVSFQEVSDRPSTYFFTENAQLSSPMSGDGLGDVGGPLSPRSAGLGSRHSGIALGSGSSGSSTGGGAAYRRVGQTDDKEKAPLRAGGGFDKASNGGQLYSTFPDLTEKETRHVEQSVDLDDAATRARHMAAMLDVEINLTTRATTNVSKDLAAFANSSAANLVVVGWARPFAALTAEGVQTTATYLLRHVHPPVALALTKGGQQARLNARHVLLVYGFKKHEREALKLALSMAADPEARVEILVARQPGDQPLEGATLDGVDDGFGGSNVGEPPRGSESVDNAIDGYDVNVDTTTASRRMWYEYLDVVVLSSLVFDMDDEKEETWDTVEHTHVGGHLKPDAHQRLDLSIGPGDVITPAAAADIEALDVAAGGASLESLVRLVQGLPNVRLVQAQDPDDLWAAALKEEAKDEHRLLLVGQSRKVFLDHHDHHHQHHHQRNAPTTFEEFADAVVAPLLVVYPPPSAKYQEKHKHKRRSRRFSVPVV